MPEPLVCCVMLVNGRPEMVRRAVASFRAQTYENKRLLVLDSSPIQSTSLDGDESIAYCHVYPGGSIGNLRNQANDLARRTEIIAHWDSDDWSHPNRLAEQVALLQSSGADVTGYDEMLFWDERKYVAKRDRSAEIKYVGGDGYPYAHIGESVTGIVNEAWLFSQRLHGKHAVSLGTSLMYWRRTWEQKPFRDTSSGEDLYFTSGLKVAAVSSVSREGAETTVVPRMIASVHGSNTSSAINPSADEWTRAPEWDAYCREQMKL